ICASSMTTSFLVLQANTKVIMAPSNTPVTVLLFMLSLFLLYDVLNHDTSTNGPKELNLLEFTSSYTNNSDKTVIIFGFSSILGTPAGHFNFVQDRHGTHTRLVKPKLLHQVSVGCSVPAH